MNDRDTQLLLYQVVTVIECVMSCTNCSACKKMADTVKQCVEASYGSFEDIKKAGT